MEDSTRFRLQQGELNDTVGDDEVRQRRDSELRVAEAEPEPGRASTPSKPFVGNAMLALLESGDVRVARGDETRVISKEHGDALERFDAEARSGTQLRPVETPRPPAAKPESSPPPPFAHSSAPPGPRVDVTLWAVLAVGLFAIAAWMIFYAL